MDAIVVILYVGGQNIIHRWSEYYTHELSEYLAAITLLVSFVQRTLFST